MSNVSADLLWEITRNNNAFLVKRPGAAAGGVQFSRDPFNLTNVHSKKNAGYINDKAVSVLSSANGGISLQTKKSGNKNKPSSHYNTANYKKTGTNRRTYASVASAVGKNSYRSDLNKDAVNRTSALKQADRPKKDTPARKPRGKKAKKTSEA